MKKRFFLILVLFALTESFLPTIVKCACSSTSYGNSVTCVQSGISIGVSTGVTNSGQVNLSPTAGHAIVVLAYQCTNSTCTTLTNTPTVSVADNLNTTGDACFTASTNTPIMFGGSPFGDIQGSMFVCDSIASGVTDFFLHCSATTSCNFTTFAVAEFTGLPSTGNLWDADGSGSCLGSVQTCTISTSTGLGFKKDLMVTFISTTNDEAETPTSPYVQIAYSGGNLASGITVNTAGTQSMTFTWGTNDQGGGTIGAIKSSVSVAASGNAMPMVVEWLTDTLFGRYLFAAGYRR